MTGDIEAIGLAVTAGLAGAAVDPLHGTTSTAAAERCLNCGASLLGSHCHQCGQRDHVNRSFGAIGHDLLHAVLHFEGKLWNTLPLLFWRPGDLTRRFVHGERASFVSPLALFLFSVFLTYSVIAMVGSGTLIEPDSGINIGNAASVQSGINSTRAEMKAALADVDARIAREKAAGNSVTDLQKKRTAILMTAKAMGFVDDTVNTGAISDTARRSFSVGEGDTGIAFIDEGLKKANENPSLMLYKLQANAYKYAWALIPLSMPFLWLLFPFSRRFHMFDHFVFITYSISFMLLLFSVVRLVEQTHVDFFTIIARAAALYVPFHMYRQLRGAYRTSRFGAFARMVPLVIFCMVTIMLFLTLLMALGIMS